ncbi:MAG: SAM-dependent DNA methyltransferase [Planctomycetes bacterium]|nr:SAM-dependent DNA methyltransferase [Planctomycetota bacterium]
MVAATMPAPRAVVEPTCGRGRFLEAALHRFSSIDRAFGLEINESHLEAARRCLDRQASRGLCEIRHGDFFRTDWKALLLDFPEPLLVIGNPPWVTNAAVGALGGSNLPKKTNFQQHSGFDALTGKSNFDISEWIIIRLLEALQGREGAVAMLCKTSAARKILTHAWKHQLVQGAELRRIDAEKHFGVSVDASLLVCRAGQHPVPAEADVFVTLSAARPASRIGLRDGRLVSNLAEYESTRHLLGEGPLRWRSGVKHDCSRVMEFRRVANGFQNGLGEVVDLEEDNLFPLLKSSDLAAGRVTAPRRWILLTQRSIGADTDWLESQAPKTWRYLQRHADRLDRRASSIYRRRPRFSIFGVGDYTFADHKIAISGLYKRLSFVHVAPLHGKPVVLDDTCSFVACRSDSEAQFVVSLLKSDLARRFYEARIFWDAKRPITADVLNCLDLSALAAELGLQLPSAEMWSAECSTTASEQLSLF